jgi:hypothetical protein
MKVKVWLEVANNISTQESVDVALHLSYQITYFKDCLCMDNLTIVKNT